MVVRYTRKEEYKKKPAPANISKRTNVKRLTPKNRQFLKSLGFVLVK